MSILLKKILRNIKAVAFDLDGTLTKASCINFERMRRRLGIKNHEDCLFFEDESSLISQKEKDKYKFIIEHEEQIGIEKCELNTGFDDLAVFLRSLPHLRRAIITRNSPHAVIAFKKRLKQMQYNDLSFFPIITRQFKGKIKPHPEPLRYVSKIWDISLENILFVGDHNDDMIFARRAGAIGILVSNSQNPKAILSASSNADMIVKNLSHLTSLLKSQRIGLIDGDDEDVKDR